MKINGKLCLSNKDDSYTIFSRGRSINLNDYLNVMLLDNAKLTVKNTYSGEVVIDVEGRLEKRKIQPKYYVYHVDGLDIDSILWDLVGSRVEIDLKNIGR